MRKMLLECLDFDWNKISPAIFGSMFQGVMDKAKRREMGAHYTSEENIEKLINPLFMDNLWLEFDKVKTDPTALDRFHNKISRLKFLEIILPALIQFKFSSWGVCILHKVCAFFKGVCKMPATPVNTGIAGICLLSVD